MAYTRRKRTAKRRVSTRSGTRNRFSNTRRPFARRRSSTRRAQKPQQIEIRVIETPLTASLGIPTALPQQVGAIAATTPRRNRF